MGKRIDLVGQRFGKLVVDGYSHTSEVRIAVWDCVCDCGNTKKVSSIDLRKKYVTSCTKCISCTYKLSEDNSYYEGYFLKKPLHHKINSDFDMSIFESDFIEIESVTKNNFDNTIIKIKPDFIFDTSLFDEINKYNWHENSNSIVASVDGRVYTLQRFIIHKINHIKLTDDVKILFKKSKSDFRLNNLLFVDINLSNNRRIFINNKKYKGVYAVKNKFMAQIKYKNKNIYLGLHDTPEQAAQAYNEKAKELFGKFAYQNVIKKPKRKKI